MGELNFGLMKKNTAAAHGRTRRNRTRQELIAAHGVTAITARPPTWPPPPGQRR